MKEHKYLSLLGASQTRMLHAKDTRLPQVEEMRNFLPGMDGCPSLRDDFTYESDATYSRSVVNVGAGGLQATDDIDCMVALFQARNGQTGLFSRFFAWNEGSVKNATYTTGTLATSDSTVTGTSTAWMQNAWTGCLLVITGNTKVYRIATVTSDTEMTTDVAVGTTAAGTAYTLYQVHNGALADYPLKIQQWGDKLIYNVNDPEPPVYEANIAGPFTNAITQGSNYVGWETVKGASTSLKLGYANSVYMLTSVSSVLYYASDPAGVWALASGWTASGFNGVVYDATAGTFAAVGTAGKIWEDSDGTAGTWTARTAAYSNTKAIATDGAQQYVIVNRNVKYGIQTSVDLTGAWTSVDTNGPFNDVYYDGTKFVAVGDDGRCYNSADAATWTSRTTGTTEDLLSVSDDGGTTVVAVGENSAVVYSLDSGDTWAVATLPDDGVTLNSVRWSGTYFVASGYDSSAHAGKVYSSTDGITWTALGLGELEAYSEIVDAVPSDAGLSNLLILASRGAATGYLRYAYYGDEYSSATTEFGTFNPLSLLHRAKTFTVTGSYLMLGALKEWDTGTSSWVYYPRRVRWPSPGTTNDFEGEGAGWLDLPGMGDILDLVTVGTNVLGFDADGVFVLEQLGDLDTPWGQRRIRSGLQLVSNVLTVGSQAFWIAHDGRIWTSNGVQIEPWSGFDISEFDDWQRSENKPIWLAWYPLWNALLVFRRMGTGTDHRIWVITEDKRISHVTLPVWTDTGPTPDETRIPYSIFVSQEPAARLYVGYEANTAVNATDLVSLYGNKGSYIRGRDVITSTITSRWFARLQTGYERLTDEGRLVRIAAAELFGYTGYTGRTLSSAASSRAPYVGLQMKTHDETSWFSPGTTTGTITVGTATCTGASTAFSNLIAAGDDVTKVFTLPCQAVQARVYRKTGSTYTLQALTTNYTITSTSVITLVAALETGTDLYAFWDAEPLVKVETGDMILTASEAHRILTIPTATSLTLDPYLTTSTAAGTHVPAELMTDGEGSTVHGIGHRGDDVQLRLTVIPQNQSDSPSSVRLSALMVEFQPLESQEKRKD